MIADIDIYRTANLMVKQYGDAAEIEAIKKAEEFRFVNTAAFDTWLEIAKAAKWLMQHNAEGQAVH